MIKRWASLWVIASGCGSLDEEIVDTRCGAADEMNVTISAIASTFITGSPSAKIHGTATHELGLAIRRITVAGLDATSDSFNFGAWSVDVPGNVIAAARPSGAMTLTLPLAVYDACSGSSAAATSTPTVQIAVQDP